MPPKSSSKLTRVAPATHQSLIIEKLPGYFLVLCLGATFAFMFYILWPFLTVIFVAAVLTIAFYPLYRKILNSFRGRARLASLVSCLLVVFVLVIPVSFFTVLLSIEAKDTYELVKENLESGKFDKYLQWSEGGVIYDLVSDFYVWTKNFDSIVDLQELDIKEKVISFGQDLSKNIAGYVQDLASGLFDVVLKFFIMLFSMYYFFKDGPKLVARIGVASPLPRAHEQELFSKITSMVKAILLGVFLTAIAQGVVGGIGYAIAGISSPVFWGTAIAFFSLVPLVGTTIVWIPTAIVLTIMGEYGAAIFIFIWGSLVIGVVDNFLRPYLIGGKAHTYPLLTFFVILGGIWTLGFKGIIIGPLVLMILMSFLHIYEAEYSKVLKK